MTDNKMIIEIELTFNGILDNDDIGFELDEWLKKLKFNHLIKKEIIDMRKD